MDRKLALFEPYLTRVQCRIGQVKLLTATMDCRMWELDGLCSARQWPC